jgi:hypothetical protein
MLSLYFRHLCNMKYKINVQDNELTGHLEQRY